MDHKLRIALSSGHHNKQKGNPVEIGLTGGLTEAYYYAFKRLGCDVRVITPDFGKGMSALDLQEVAQQVVDWASGGWVADIYLETHTEGVDNPKVRGVFAIYPDVGTDVDTVVRDTLGPMMVKAISKATGIPIRGNGVMSEKDTGVGRGGDRLGIFLRTEPIAATTTRLIIEHGSHTSPEDLAILRQAGTFEKIATAAAWSILDYYGIPVIKAEPDIIVEPTSGKVLGYGFKAFWRKLQAAGDQLHLLTLGYPLTNDFAIKFSDKDSEQIVQLFERGGLVWDKAATAPWDIHQLKVPYLIEAYAYAVSNGFLDAELTLRLGKLLQVAAPVPA
ncbi:MAG: hypothetical protein ACRDEA_16545, partial [Microcystaceae cyanobacterium]